MRLLRLRVSDLRVVRAAELEPAAGLTIIEGPNGSGKSTLLEAVHLCGLARSWRTRRRLDLVRRGSEALSVHAVVTSANGVTTSLGVEHARGGRRLRVDGESASSAAVLARLLPLAVVTPDSQRLLTDGADLRRRLLDWSMFHVEQAYSDIHRRYRRAVRQRTAALREGAARDVLSSWNRETGEAGEALHAVRARLVGEILPSVEQRIGALLDREVSAIYRPGWDSDRALADVLEANTAADRARGYGEDGPHRADLVLRVDGRAAQHVLSRGESKLFVASIVLAQVDHLERWRGEPPVVLVDDLASELDRTNRGRFFDALRETGAQTIVTSVECEPDVASAWTDQRRFHVEQGEVAPVV